MKLFKTNAGVVIEKEKNFFLVEDENWDTFTNDVDVFEKATTLTATLPADDKKLIETTLPLMGNKQELWVCGVTDYRSIVGSPEESKAQAVQQLGYAFTLPNGFGSGNNYSASNKKK